MHLKRYLVSQCPGSDNRSDWRLVHLRRMSENVSPTLPAASGFTGLDGHMHCDEAEVGHYRAAAGEGDRFGAVSLTSEAKTA